MLLEKMSLIKKSGAEASTREKFDAIWPHTQFFLLWFSYLSYLFYSQKIEWKANIQPENSKSTDSRNIIFQIGPSPLTAVD